MIKEKGNAANYVEPREATAWNTYTLCRITGLGALTLLLSGCGATPRISQGDSAIEAGIALLSRQVFSED